MDMRTPATPSRWTTGQGKRSLRVAVAALAAACGGSIDGPTGPPVPTTPIGSYTIQTVNGKPLPVAMFADTNYTYEITSGKLSLGTDGKYSVVTAFKQTIPGNISIFVDSSSGVWVQNGSAIQLTSLPDSSKDNGTWDKGLLTFSEPFGKTTASFVYYQAR